MDIELKNSAGIVVIALLLVALGLAVAGIETVAGFEVLAAGEAAVGYLAAGNFSVGVVSAGMFSVGVFAAGIFSVGVFAIGIFSVGIFSFGIYAAGFYAVRRHVSDSGASRADESAG